ncbi:MAG: alpha/beta hydrolase [Bacteroidetes bacterium]|nr:alpha/beta hydrolase [Bacteroidota bacterium]
MVATINNTMINYTLYENENRTPPLVFIHGFPFSSEMWEPQVSALSSKVTMVTYDVRGLGKSAVGDGQYTIELFVDDLIALLDYLKIATAVLCGLSMGGYIALRTFQRYPERIAGLILSNTKSEADNNQAKIQRAQTILRVKHEGLTPFADEFIQKLFAPTTFTTNPHIIDRIRSMILNTPLLGFCGVQLALAARTDTTEFLPSITVPTLLIAGNHDRFSPPCVMETMHKNIPNSEFHVFSNSAHMCNLEEPEHFTEIVGTFIKRYFHGV